VDEKQLGLWMEAWRLKRYFAGLRISDADDKAAINIQGSRYVVESV
jgi:hypothetical protein